MNPTLARAADAYRTGARSRCAALCREALGSEQRPADRVRTLALLGRVLSELGHRIQAIEAGTQALAWAEGELVTTAALSLGETYLRAGRPGDALRVLRMADPSDPHTRRLLATAEHQTGTPGATEHILSLIEASEANHDAVERGRCEILYATALADRGELRGAVFTAGNAVRLLQEAGDDKALAEARIQAAEIYGRAGLDARSRETAGQTLRYLEEQELDELRRRADRLHRPEPQGVDLRLAQLSALTIAIAEQVDQSTILQRVAESARQVLRADRAFVVLMDGDQPTLAARCLLDTASEAPPSATIVQRVLQSRRELVAPNLGALGQLGASQSILVQNLHAAVCIPLLDGGEVLGAVYVDKRTPLDETLAADLLMLRTLASHAVLAIRHAQARHAAARRAEEAEELIHDLRTPLTAVLLAAAFIKKESHEEARSAASDIEESARRVQTLAEEVVRPRIRPAVPVDLPAMAESLASAYGHIGRARGITVRSQVQGDPVGLHGDPTALRRALGNLLGNAIRHSPDGGVVELCLDYVPDEVRIRVTDQGPGVPEADRQRVFERGHSSSGSQGLGLAIVHRVATQHRGRVSCEPPQSGVGAEFVLSVPCPSS